MVTCCISTMSQQTRRPVIYVRGAVVEPIWSVAVNLMHTIGSIHGSLLKSVRKIFESGEKVK